MNCKFGVIYAKADQNTDAQMLSNGKKNILTRMKRIDALVESNEFAKKIEEHGDESFERFLKILGQRIELQGWGSYRGGLDTTSELCLRGYGDMTRLLRPLKINFQFCSQLDRS